MITQSFGQTRDGRDTELITISNDNLCCTLTTYGASIVSLRVKDKARKQRDIVQGFDTVRAYEEQDKYIGATIGRYANRIGGARFTLNDREYRLSANEGRNHHHGGVCGFDKRIWNAVEVEDGVRFRLRSPHMDEGYPGNLDAAVKFTISGSALTIAYEAESDSDTVCNLTNHAYFNLNGHGAGTAIGHMLKLYSETYTPLSQEERIPYGAFETVSGTPMDFRVFTKIGERIDDDDEQLLFGGGYDHNWVVSGEPGRLRPAAEVYSPDSGIKMSVDTTMPGIQFYSGNYLNGCPAGKNGANYSRRSAFCLETQFFPNSPNCPEFPQPILKKTEVWQHTTVLSFDTV